MTGLSPEIAAWIGRTEAMDDRIDLTPVSRMSATLDRDDPAPAKGDALPPLWHWMYFVPTAPMSKIGTDGHASKGEFLPPIPFPRRMWAGSSLIFHQPLKLGEEGRRDSVFTDIQIKEGRNGPLAFVSLRHEISGPQGLAITDDQTVVYRPEQEPGEKAAPPQDAPTDYDWDRQIEPNSALLFRYSALTFNGHKIHYDHPHVTGVEGYPGLIIHGPLLATLLVDLVRRHLPDRAITRFSFRALRPVFDISPFRIQGKCEGDLVHLWALDNEGYLAMTAEAGLGAG